MFAICFATSLISAASEPVPTDPRLYELRKSLSWCAGGSYALPGLDDRDCAKRFPPLFERDFTCPTSFATDPNFGPSAANVSAIALDENTLKSALQTVSPEAKLAVAVIKRNEAGEASVRYLGVGARKPVQPWSSTKTFAASNGAVMLRNLSRGSVGLGAVEDGADRRALGDLVTVITSYDHTLGLTSNSLGAYFHSIGGHERANALVHEWLGAPASESFGGNYGEAVSPRLGRSFHDSGASVSVPEDPDPSPAIENHMSPLTMVEWMRRIVLLREDTAATLPSWPGGFSWSDAASVLYGAHASASAFGEQMQWGGMAQSTDIYLQQAVEAAVDGGLDAAEKSARGRWRIFSKLGAGKHGDQWNIVLNGYICLPVLDDNLMPVPDRGLELALSLWTPLDARHSNLAALDLKVTAAMESVMRELVAKYYGGSTSKTVLI